MIVDFIVTFPFFKDLIARKDTRPISLISYWSIRDTRRLAWPVLRSLTNFSFPWAYW
jgi:hypothetical protein